MKKPKLYRRLASAHQFGFAYGGWSSLHLAPDHLLLRSSRGFRESYRRFYFPDIEAISIAKSSRGGFLNVLWGLPLFFSVLFLIFRPGWTPGVLTNMFAALLFINLARGATCLTTLQTRVQTQRLPLRRVKKRAAVSRLLAAKIVPAQADLPVSATPPPIVRSTPPPLALASSLGKMVPPLLPANARFLGRPGFTWSPSPRSCSAAPSPSGKECAGIRCSSILSCSRPSPSSAGRSPRSSSNAANMSPSGFSRSPGSASSAMPSAPRSPSPLSTFSES